MSLSILCVLWKLGLFLYLGYCTEHILNIINRYHQSSLVEEGENNVGYASFALLETLLVQFFGRLLFIHIVLDYI